MIELIEQQKEAIITLCKAHQVTAISLFGSAAKNEHTPSSDLDFLVMFSEDIDVLDYADNYFSFLESLADLTGREIDLVSVKSLKNPVLIEEINQTKIDLYAA